MDEHQTTPNTQPAENLGEHGIFEPKPLNTDMMPLSGAEKAKRLAIVIAAILLGAVLWMLLKDPFMRPVQRYYRGLERDNPAAMTKAFPDFLVDGTIGEDAVSIEQMCSVADTNKKYSYDDAPITVKLQQKTAVEDAYLQRLAQGMSDRYGKEIKITAGYRCQLAVIYFRGDDDRETTVTEYVRVYKINGSWRMLDIASPTA